MESLFLLNSCCEQAAAGMLRAFPVHFVPLQSNNTQCNVHGSPVATENYMKCGFSYETDCFGNYCEERFLMNLDFICLHLIRALCVSKILVHYEVIVGEL